MSLQCSTIVFIYKCVNRNLDPSLIFSFLVPLVRLISMLGLKAVHTISIGNTIPYPGLNHIMNIMTSIYSYSANVWQTLPWDHKVLHRHTTSNVVELILYSRRQSIVVCFLCWTNWKHLNQRNNIQKQIDTDFLELMSCASI